MNPPGPRASRHLGHLYEFPVDLSITLHGEEVADCRTYIDTCILISVRARLFALKHIEPVIYSEWSNILPLSVGNFSLVMDCDPSIVANGYPGAPVRLPKPGNDR